DVGARRESGSTIFAPPPTGRARLAATIAIDAKGAASIDHLELDVPGSSTLVCPGVRCDCKVDVTKIDRKRAGEVKLAIDGTVGVAPHAYKVHADVSTFVRDIVDDARKSPAAPAPRAPPR